MISTGANVKIQKCKFTLEGQNKTSGGYAILVAKDSVKVDIKDSTIENYRYAIYVQPTSGEIKITNRYYHTIFYKNKKYTAKIKNNKIATNLGFLDVVSNKKAQNIEEITKLNETNERNDFIIEQFKAQNQRSVDINYKNLNDRTKHYLELK